MRMNNSYLTACGIQLHQAMLHSREGLKACSIHLHPPFVFLLGWQSGSFKMSEVTFGGTMC